MNFATEIMLDVLELSASIEVQKRLRVYCKEKSIEPPIFEELMRKSSFMARNRMEWINDREYLYHDAQYE